MLGRMLLFFCFLFLFSFLQAQRIYVSEQGTGLGTSWEDAMGDLQLALGQAGFGTEIWVSAGTYFPTRIHDRQAHFTVPDGVMLYGGFNGSESDLSQRNWHLNPTFLSGEIGTSAPSDNSFTVLYTSGVSTATVVDGFMITGGMANGVGERGDKVVSGGGWYNDGTRMPSTPEIRNCTFINNFGREGAAFFNNGSRGNAMVTVQNCTFTNNVADLDGGAIYNESKGGNAYLFLRHSIFDSNEASYGAGIFNSNKEGVGRVDIQDCEFTNNLSYIRGSTIYETGKVSAIVGNSIFQNNVSSFGKEDAPVSPVEDKVSKGTNTVLTVKSAGS